jgi:citrate synthase
MILAGLSAYAASDPDCVAIRQGEKQFLGDMEAVNDMIIRSLSATAVVVALAYCHQHNRALTLADPDGSFVANVLRMMGVVDPGTARPSPKVVQCLERLWVLYAEHEMTNSTAAFLHAASTLTDPLSCIVASAVSGFGPLHGGAIDIAYRDFRKVGAPERVPQLIADVKAKKRRLFGYGHRIYKTVDPRARLLRAMIDEQLADEVNGNALLAVALEIDRIASTDQYFTSRNLKANADLYGTFVYIALYVVSSLSPSIFPLPPSISISHHLSPLFSLLSFFLSLTHVSSP